jgi:tetratricopeptide (TPR) repeat protein
VSLSLSKTTPLGPASLPPELGKQIEALVQSNQNEPLGNLLVALLAHYPNDVELHHLLGWTRTRQGRLHEAEIHFRDAIRLKPDASGSYNNLGLILMDLERVGEALNAFEVAIRLQPHYASALTNAAFAYARLNYPERAIPLLEKAIKLEPNFAEAHHHMGYVLMNLRRLDEAEAELRLAMSLQPENAGYVNTFGLLREAQHHAEEATSLFLRALTMQPDLAHAWNNLGTIHAAVWGNLEKSLECFDRVLAFKPHFSFARHHRGMVELTLGDFARGWENYEFRPTQQDKPPERFRRPLWRGEPLGGKTILLHAEQGLGDTLQCIRYAHHIKKRGATVVAVVQKALVKLVSRTPGIDTLLAEGVDLPPHDFQVPLLSIPRVLGIPPNESPYLFPDEELVTFWKQRLSQIAGFKIGIAWQGDSTFKYDWLRSIPLAEFAPLTKVPNCHLINLQKFEGIEQIATNCHHVPVIELEPQIDTTRGPFMDTAAIMKSLDLVITSDTSIAHLAGGLGVPVWVAIAYAPDWRWMVNRDDSPWYPTLRIFRQSEIRRWDNVFTRMASEIQQKRVPAS